MSGPIPMAIKPQGPLDERKAWLLGVVAGDGGINYEQEKYSYKFCVNAGLDQDFAEEVRAALVDVYGVESQVRHVPPAGARQGAWRTNCDKKLVIEDLLRYSRIGNYDWDVPDEVMGADERIRCAWLRGFADSDGCVTCNLKIGQRHVTLDSVNEKALYGRVYELFKSVGIEARKMAPSKRTDQNHQHWLPQCKLLICHSSDMKAFAEKVGFSIARKQQILTEAVNSYKRTPKKSEFTPEFISSMIPKIVEMRADGKSFPEIAKTLGLPDRHVPKRWIHNRGIKIVSAKLK